MEMEESLLSQPHLLQGCTLFFLFFLCGRGDCALKMRPTIQKRVSGMCFGQVWYMERHWSWKMLMGRKDRVLSLLKGLLTLEKMEQ
ncbi:rCG28692 [Rattus norvegicus]|uniref:RCG28692 n=1 Tax=Rattus norvegicus TaxID=10116 RepID=A6HUS2_RAT|nr:rCG28692 [Rattus norvegicus]